MGELVDIYLNTRGTRERYLNDPQSVPARQRPRGRPALGMPVPPPWAVSTPRHGAPAMSNQHLLNAPPDPSMPNIPIGPGGVVGSGYGMTPANSGPALHVRVPGANSPGAYGNFADYANQTNNLPPPLLEAPPAPQGGMGIFGRRRGLEPPNAPQGQSMAQNEAIAMQEAIMRARAQRGGDPTGLRQAARDEIAAIQNERARQIRNANRGG